MARLTEKGVDPIRIGDLTYPMMVTILTDGTAGAKRRETLRARKLLADVKAGRLAWRE